MNFTVNTRFSTSPLLVMCLLLSLLAGCVRTPQGKAAAYDMKIVAPEKPGSGLQPALDDLQSTLREMTGTQYSLGTGYTGAGIFLMRSDMAGAPADAVAKLKGKGFEPFILRSSDEKNLWIIANADEGLCHGIYYYLEQLGARWLLPGDNWTVIPQKANVTIKMDTLVIPAFKSRSFFGTGGFGPLAPYDPTLDFKTRMLDWQRRNRFGAEYHLDGHSGEAFNTKNKDILLQHPEYLAKVDGKHVPWSVTAKLNTANPEAVRLFVDWTVERMRQKRTRTPDSPYSVAVSVDPADGGGHCNSGECKQIGNGSPSDQVFYIANQAARAIRKEFPDGNVNLYAYNAHAAVPSFPLEKNIIVSIIPYAFQSTGLSPAEFIKAWGEKLSDRINLYDYWNITDWAHDKPSFNYLTVPAEKLRFWHENNIEGFSGESTYGAGAMGIGWYVASRLMWSPQVDEKALIEEWYDLAFGPAKAPMKRMMERWAQSFMMTSAELGLSYRDIQEAYPLATGDARVTARLDDYARYLHYLRLSLELETTTGPETRTAKEREYVEHLFDIYDSMMIHSFRLYQFAVDYGRKKDLFSEFDNRDKEAPGWKRVAPLLHDEVAALVADGVKKYLPPTFEIVAYNGKRQPLQPINKWTPPAADDVWSTIMPTKGAMDIEIIAPEGLQTLPLRVSRYYDCKVGVIDTNGQQIFQHEITGVKQYQEWDEMQIPLPQPGRYTIQFLPAPGTGFRFQTLKGIPLSFGRFISEMGAPSPRLYFYVPKGLTTIAMYYPSGGFGASPVSIFNPAGDLVPAQLQDDGRLLTVPVAPGQDGKVWSLQGSRSPNQPPQTLNIPESFGFSPETLLVPVDALQ